jgi:hypothetical protein
MGFSYIFWYFQTLRGVGNDVFPSEKMIERQLSTHGGPKTKLVSFRDAIKLVMVLPGKIAKETRAQFASIIERYLAGDKTLHAEIDGNAESSSPIAQLARASVMDVEQAGDKAELVGLKRRREELELFRLEEEIKGMAQSRIITASAELERIRDPTKSNLDDRTRLMIQDALQNSLINTQFSAGSKMVTNGDGVSSNAPISIASVAAKLGYKPTTADAKRIGLDIRKRYIKLYDKSPPKHDQLCDGRVTSVNSYTERDRSLLEDSLHAYFRPSESDAE